MRTLSKIAVAPSLAAGLIAAGVGVAHASVLGGYNGNGVYIRSGASTSHKAYGQGQSSQEACLYYYVSGQNINGDPYWDYNKDLDTSVRAGYSADYYMYSVGRAC